MKIVFHNLLIIRFLQYHQSAAQGQSLRGRDTGAGAEAELLSDIRPVLLIPASRPAVAYKRAQSRPASQATGAKIASRIPCRSFLSEGQIVAKTPPNLVSRSPQK